MHILIHCLLYAGEDGQAYINSLFIICCGKAVCDCILLIRM